MRCLGRLVFLLLLVVAAAIGWLYRDELLRWGRARLDPAQAEQRIGRPSEEALASAVAKIDRLAREQPDSVLLDADEMASLVKAGASFLGDATLDSVTVELGDRSVRLRGLVDGERLPERWRAVMPSQLRGPQEVIASGTITPARPGVAEWQLERVLVRGIPVPSALVARAVGNATNTGTDGRLDVRLPRRIQGFRVRPEGVAVYRDAAAR